MTDVPIHRNWQIFWRVYFWFYAILFIISFIFSFYLRDFIGVILVFVFFGLNLLGLYGYVYKERIFSAIFWKIYSFIYPSYLIYINTRNFPNYLKIFDNSISEVWTAFIIAILIANLIVTPAIVAVFLYAFRFFKESEVEGKTRFQWRFTPFIKSKRSHR